MLIICETKARKLESFPLRGKELVGEEE